MNKHPDKKVGLGQIERAEMGKADYNGWEATKVYMTSFSGHDRYFFDSPRSVDFVDIFTSAIILFTSEDIN